MEFMDTDHIFLAYSELIIRHIGCSFSFWAEFYPDILLRVLYVGWKKMTKKTNKQTLGGGGREGMEGKDEVESNRGGYGEGSALPPSRAVSNARNTLGNENNSCVNYNHLSPTPPRLTLLLKYTLKMAGWVEHFLSGCGWVSGMV